MRKICLWIIIITFLNGCGESLHNRKKKHFLHKGNVAFREKLYDEAIRYYREALETDPGYAQAYNNLGIVYVKTGEYHQAAEAFDRCLEKDPDFTEAYYNRSNANNELGNYYKALDDLMLIDGKYDPGSAIQFSRGIAFFGLKNYDSGISKIM
jgi:tetratricopeptide (TPR) repeat protein